MPPTRDDDRNGATASVNQAGSQTSGELKKIWIVASGSRGDIQPYAAVAGELVRSGYEVTFFAPGKPDLLALAKGLGVKRVVALTRDFTYDEYPSILTGMFEGNTKLIFEGIAQANKDNAPVYCNAFCNEKETNGLPDMILAMPLGLYIALYFAINFQVPFLELSTYSPYYDPDRATFGFPNLPFGLNRYIVHNVLPWLMYKGFDIYDEIMENPILKKYTSSHLIQRYGSKEHYMLVLQSPILRKALVSRDESQEKPHNTYVGTTVIEDKYQLTNDVAFGDQDLRKRISDFIEQSPTKPIYIGWGSMVCKSTAHMAAVCANAAHFSKQRVIVFNGGGEYGTMSLETLKQAKHEGLVEVEDEVLEHAQENLLFVGRVPHEWLLPQMAATVHHGGAGTTTAALRAGVPSIITPLIADQFDFSHAINQLGVGIGFKTKLPNIHWKELGQAILSVVENPKVKDQAAKVGKALCAENGARRAVEEAEKYWKEHCVTGKFHEEFSSSIAKPQKSLLQKVSSVMAVVAAAGGISAIIFGHMRGR